MYNTLKFNLTLKLDKVGLVSLKSLMSRYGPARNLIGILLCQISQHSDLGILCDVGASPAKTGIMGVAIIGAPRPEVDYLTTSPRKENPKVMTLDLF